MPADEIQQSVLHSIAHGEPIPDDVVAALEQLLHRGQQFMAMRGGEGKWHLHYVGPVRQH